MGIIDRSKEEELMKQKAAEFDKMAFQEVFNKAMNTGLAQQAAQYDKAMASLLGPATEIRRDSMPPENYQSPVYPEASYEQKARMLNSLTGPATDLKKGY